MPLQLSHVIHLIRTNLGDYPEFFTLLRAEEKRLSIPKRAYERKEVYRISEVLSRLNTKEVVFDGDVMDMTSIRYQVFCKSLTCPVCGITGVFFAKERAIARNPEKVVDYTGENFGKYHFNLYAIDKNGKEVLMTKDHIIPKSKGGSNHISNLQTMCTNCNSKKGNKA